jgi:polyhydroxybutyrate depolymerase
MQKWIPVLLCLMLPVSLLQAQETVTGSFEFDGQERDFRLRIPPSSFDGARPLVFNLHGFGSNAFQQEAYAQMNPVADTAGFYVCYPNGISNAWNVGWTFGSTADDVGFISALIDTLAAQYSIDPERIYACGMSNGGFMSYRLACELNDRIAAIASVTGSMVPAYISECAPGRPVPVLEIHGTEDATVPYEGQPLLAISIEELLAFWNANNGCDGDAVTAELPNTNTTDASTVSFIESAGCAERGDVWHFRINGGGHTWPGSPIAIGVTNQDINGSAEIWHFFSRFTLSGLSSSADHPEPVRLALFPNPTRGQAQVVLPESGGELMVFNAAGQPVIRQLIEGRLATLDLFALPPGAYWVIARQGGAVCIGQLLRQ